MIQIAIAGLSALCLFSGGVWTGYELATGQQAKEAALVKQVQDAAAISTAQEIAKIQIVNKTIRQEVMRETIEKPVYRDCKHDPAVLQLINDALRGRSNGADSVSEIDLSE